MIDETLQPTAVTSPDPGQGGSAVTGAATNGHGSTTSSASGAGNSQSKTCLWTVFDSPVIQPVVAVLKLEWSQNGSIDHPEFGTNNSFTIQYSTNGGGGWTTLHTATGVTSSSSGSSEVSLGMIDVANLHVRDLVYAQGGTGGLTDYGAGITTTVSDIRLEITYGADRIMMGMM